jgi:hypothetical protein
MAKKFLNALDTRLTETKAVAEAVARIYATTDAGPEREAAMVALTAPAPVVRLRARSGWEDRLR